MKVYNMQYPMDTRRKEYDGRKHNITPQSLRSFDYDNQKLYFLFYFDNDLKQEMYTFLIKKGSSFMKLPINCWC